MARWFMLIALTLAAAGTAGAQINHPCNEVGIYTVEQPEGCATAQVEAPAGTVFTCYVVLTEPRNETAGQSIANVGGFEFRLGLPDDVHLLASWQPPFDTDGFDPPDFAYGAHLPVVDGRCTLMWFQLMPTTAEPRFLSLLPVQGAPQSIPGEMAFTDYDDEFSLHVMHPVSGSFDVPVFAINWEGDLPFCETVPARAASFGTVKALYR